MEQVVLVELIQVVQVEMELPTEVAVVVQDQQVDLTVELEDQV